jgi:hypothetical protein
MMKTIAPIVIAAADGQFAERNAYAYPQQQLYNMAAPNMAGNYMTGNYYPGNNFGENYARQCMKGQVSADLPNSFMSCYCDKNHRDEDPCSVVEDQDRGHIGDESADEDRSDFDLDETECRKFYDYYKDDVFDEDCVAPFYSQNTATRPRNCQAKTKSIDLPPFQACWCDSNHKKEWENDSNCYFNCNLGPTARRLAGIGPLECEGEFDEDFALLLHYQEISDNKLESDYFGMEFSFVGYMNGNDNMRKENCDSDPTDEWDEYDPNCVERFGGYGGYQNYGNQYYGNQYFNQPMYQQRQYQQMYYPTLPSMGVPASTTTPVDVNTAAPANPFQYPPFGNNFYSTATMSTTGLPASTAAPAAPTFQYQQFPQYQQLNGGWGGYYNGGWGGNYNGGWGGYYNGGWGGNYGNPMGAYHGSISRNWGR